MAERGGKFRKDTNFQSVIDLKGVLTTSVRAELVIEFINHLLYQRQQVSLPIDQIRKDVSKYEQAAEGLKSCTTARQNAESRKKKVLVDSVDELSSTLMQLFSLASSVRSVLLSLGPTTVSPKETYLLRFPTSVFDGKVLSIKHCKTALFRQLVASPFFEDVSPPKSCTKLSVLVELLEPICEDIPLIPKENYKIPSRGGHLELGFVCHTKVVSADLTRGRDVDFDMSGVEPLNHSVLDTEHSSLVRRLTSHGSQGSDDVSMAHSSPGLAGTPLSTGSFDHMDIDPCNTPRHCLSPMLICDTPSPDNNADLYAWFQLPVSVQGYREKSSKPTGFV